ncbi:MAG TPA: hypothetical protein VD884_07440 [Ohtaekwangia sp.]|nr:hypothetical protein [Ohtaekwangia sp.]
MKHVNRILSLLALSAMVFLTGCDKGDDNKKSENDQQIEKLVGTWTAQEVTLDTDPQEYPGFTITISGSAGDDQLSYTTSNRPANGPWPASGNLSFGSPATNKLIRSGDNLDINYQVSDAQLTMSFNYEGDGFAGGRTAEVAGDWVFTFTKSN